MKNFKLLSAILPLFLLTTQEAQSYDQYKSYNDPRYANNQSDDRDDRDDNDDSDDDDDGDDDADDQSNDNRYQQQSQRNYNTNQREPWRTYDEDYWKDGIKQNERSQSNRSNKNNSRQLSENELKHQSAPVDSSLRQKIKDKLTNTWFSKSYKNIDIEVANGNITLRGTVESKKDLEEIEKRIRSLGPEVKNLRIQIQVTKE